MTIDDLKGVRRQQLDISSLQERILRLRAAMERSTPSYRQATGGTPDPDWILSQLAKLEQLEGELRERVIAMESSIQAVDDAISRLPDQQAIVMRLRYVDGLSWRVVAKRAGYSIDHCFSIHRGACSKLNSF